jgi:AraC-like DNA-binding protein
MSYREHAPPAALVPWLECIWERRAEPGQPVRVLPDGCIDIVWTEGAGAQVVGANRTAFLVPTTMSVRVIGARMRPGCAPALLGIGAEAVLDARLPIADALSDVGRRLEAALAESRDPIGTLRSELVARSLRAERPDPLVRAAVAGLDQSEVSISRLARALGVSERGLRRRISASVGYGPRRLARVLRLGRALEAARSGGELARVAYEAGYADQAHFTNDCRALAGVPPSIVLAGGDGDGRPLSSLRGDRRIEPAARSGSRALLSRELRAGGDRPHADHPRVGDER